MSDTLLAVNDGNFDAEVVLKSDQLVLVKFGAEWCAPCKRLTPIVEKFAQSNPTIKVVTIDVDDAPNMSGQYHIRSVPVLMLFKGGKLLGSKVGMMSLTEIEVFVTEKSFVE
jgi:thioredoxin 1